MVDQKTSQQHILSRLFSPTSCLWPIWEMVRALNYSTVSDPLPRYVSNYKQSMRNVAAEGIDILCYNFMPVVDWTRTDLEFEWGDGSKALKFDGTAFAAFDIFILGRASARKDYTEKQVFAALRRSLARGSSSRIGVSWEGESS